MYPIEYDDYLQRNRKMGFYRFNCIARSPSVALPELPLGSWSTGVFCFDRGLLRYPIPRVALPGPFCPRLLGIDLGPCRLPNPVFSKPPRIGQSPSVVIQKVLGLCKRPGPKLKELLTRPSLQFNS